MSVNAARGSSVEVIQVPNTLRQKVGGGLAGIDANALAKAEAALKDLSSQFSQWLLDEIVKLETARAAVRNDDPARAGLEAVYVHAHDLKGLGTTYEFPLITRIAGSLCTLLEDVEVRLSAPMTLIDAHIGAIRVAYRDGLRDAQHPAGAALETAAKDFLKTRA